MKKPPGRHSDIELENNVRKSSDYKEPEMNPERLGLDFISNREPQELIVYRRDTKYPMFYKWESVRGEIGEY